MMARQSIMTFEVSKNLVLNIKVVLQLWSVLSSRSLLIPIDCQLNRYTCPGAFTALNVNTVWSADLYDLHSSNMQLY